MKKEEKKMEELEPLTNNRMLRLLRDKRGNDFVPDEQIIDIDYSELRSMEEIKSGLIDKVPYFQSECKRIDLLEKENLERKNTLVIPFIESKFTGKSSVTKELFTRNIAFFLEYNPMTEKKYIVISEARPISCSKTSTDLYQGYKSPESCISIGISTLDIIDLIAINYVVRLLHEKYLRFCF